ncbi:MAG: thymidylate kinase [Candidatus Roizmanbacteria bacterium GW2011_GWB1_40_7]|uniref:Thymidylate kinase n=2 Tax=Candidatus Roizmaniibacteriota TaxID=1752723 RepID=A0A0G0X8G4_9BACT|nr:MAG: thymidylate kinase [Candidatus Roizmanbacteria bacterium GW2011_GWB1_40_7]KKS21210.1 MAG: thymidylate kinase [Candidatus Roizmanbacteria bacterium GW2011_GWC2_41_7]
MNGKLIVIEGGDGSGKATQAKLLVDYFKKEHISAQTISFPRYQDSFYGKLVGRFLKGELGKLEEVSPYIAALMYALDRKDARDEIVQWLTEGSVVIADRYVTSNLAHQAAKLSEEKQEGIISWIEEMEYEVNKMPRPDIVIYLHVPPSYSIELISIEAADIAENKLHQQNTENVYKRLATSNSMWHTIECVQNGKLRTIPEIHTELLHILRTKLL